MSTEKRQVWRSGFIATVAVIAFAGLSNVQAAQQYSQRYAIAISGGASKGAYEAGLNWALIKMLRVISGAPSALGGQYNPTEIDSVTGASAGGINSLLSAVAWCSRPEKDGGITDSVDNNVFRDTWLLPDVNQLLPERADSPVYRYDDAMLSRKTILDAAESLRQKWRSASFRPGCSIKLGVTVTRVEPQNLTLGNVEVQNQRFYIPFEFYVSADGKGHFRFDPNQYSRHWDPAMILFPTKKGAPRHEILDEQIQTAVLTSSAFPVAFGRKRFEYCRQKTRRISVEVGTQPENAETLNSEWVCPTGYVLEEAVFSDGGLFDNLPIGLARILAENSESAQTNPAPIAYIYLDPNRLRYAEPDPTKLGACGAENPPPACKLMAFNFSSESTLLLGALGTARKYELYRELLDKKWSLNMSEIAYGMANEIEEKNSRLKCKEEFPYFHKTLSCVDALRRTGQLMEITYDHRSVPVTSPFSVSMLRQSNLVYNCREAEDKEKLKVRAVCNVNVYRLRERLAVGLEQAAKRAGLYKKYRTNIQQSRRSLHNDRIIRVSSRGAPITGTLLADFGAFLEYKFREYDYYVGVYDAIILASAYKCSLHFSQELQPRDYRQCVAISASKLVDGIGLNQDRRGRYVFALLAQREFGSENVMKFAYKSMPEEVSDMKIIHEGLEKSLAAGEKREGGPARAFAVEKEFFHHLKENGFEPTHSTDGTEPMLSAIMEDPEEWSHELMKRVTQRLVYLEQEAEKIYEAREPDPEKREQAMTGIMGITSYVLQSNTYKYPDYTFAPSTAPESWFWRNVIPYEVAFDMAESDLMLSWQPTWALGKKTTTGVRATYGVAGGLFQSVPSGRPDYVALGIDVTRLTSYSLFSSWWITPTYFHRIGTPAFGTIDTWGVDFHVGMLKNRMRLGFGTRNLNDASNTWFLSVGLTDLPGLVYWLSR